MHKQLRIIIAGGGTGGHIFPAIAVAQAIQQLQPDAAILFIGAKGKMEMEKVPQAGFLIQGLTIAGFNRSSILKNWSLPFKLIKSFFQVKKIFKEFKPNAVFGVGGYSSFPVLKYAQAKNICTFIHEANAYAGKSNKMLGANATKIFTGTIGMERFFPVDKIMFTGNPVRKNIFSSIYSKEAALLKFGLLPNRKTILVIGGSLGAASINNVIKENLQVFADKNLQLIWQTGKTNEKIYYKSAEAYPNVYVNVFIDDMSAAYTAADFIVSRSGAMAVAEIGISQKPCLFVPYPYSAEDHQTFNAMTLVKEGAAFMVSDKDVKEKLCSSMIQIIEDEKILNQMVDKIKSFAFLNADQLIAAEIIQQVEKVKF
jgi:UDP-N-acetylglucosamine--N-acetylmuramyl-(pentapeptide) pyrophosphoryl-undecaprenol N-acetylglucosamine transferase